jgi:hypothetical protein
MKVSEPRRQGESVISASRLLEFAGIAAVIIAIPGPSVLFTVSRALPMGRGTALLNVAGNEAGLVVQAIAVAFGLGLVVARSRSFVGFGCYSTRNRRTILDAHGVGERRDASQPPGTAGQPIGGCGLAVRPVREFILRARRLARQSMRAGCPPGDAEHT